MKKHIELGMFAHMVMSYLQKDRERAEAIISIAFPNHSIRKDRSDKGKPKGEPKRPREREKAL
jgi:hypothetical protein